MIDDTAAFVRGVVDDNLFMILGTADGDGRPWTSPVYFTHADYREFYWMSSPDVTHSRNLARRPEVSIVIFDSRVRPGDGAPVYLAAVAEELAGDDVERALTVYPGPLQPGVRSVTLADVTAPSPYRLYRATASEHSILCPRPTGVPCALHGRAYDHRTTVTP
ncbi:MAG: pyridoxamine 5'-phosphate oxidase family protein [Streptosporangiales bacterium]|nr:pyridoxamine 5'-phosphate oxidase family protein [Streptosporangiales bacterium]